MDPIPTLIGTGVSLALVLVALFFARAEGRALPARVLAALAPVAGVIATYAVLGHTPAVWPATFHGKVVSVGVAAALVGALAPAGRIGDALRVLGVAALGFALFRFGTEALHANDWAGRVPLFVAAYAGAAVLLQVGRAVADGASRTAEVALATAIAALATAPLIGWTGSGLSAMMLATLSGSAGLFGLALVALPRLREASAPLGRALSTSQSILLVGLCANGLLFSEARLPVVAMAVFSPLVVLLPGRGLGWALARLTLVAALSGGAIALEQAHRDAQPKNPYADAYGG